MEYLALIYADETAWEGFSDDTRSAMYEQYGEFARAAGDAGVLAGGEELGPTASATTVRLREGRQLVTDGPYAEAKEALGGLLLAEPVPVGLVAVDEQGVLHGQASSSTWTCRTSTAPCEAPGIRAAHASASSRDSQSRMK